ncbi:MAG: hypothetical protein JO079_01535, partial [Frankiaceae bacterium]|nr:hypothetical protein [Frankiaceae bacterium]MBV9368411.1 hypothetical protein [Frankiales bacterium]
MMLSALSRRIRRAEESDGGFAMIAVIGWGFVLMLLVSTVAAYSLLSLSTSRHEQDYGAALAAAQAGIDDYLSRLNANNAYWQSVDCTNPAMAGPGQGTNSCGWTASTAAGYMTVPGAVSVGSGKNCQGVTPVPVDCPAFHYDIDTSQTLSNGTIKITSTGKAWKVKRTAQAILHQQGFADFLYFSDLETTDPSNQLVYGVNNATAKTRCSVPYYYWQGGASYRGNNPCNDIVFISADTINGPLHTNDTMDISGNPQFLGPVSTGNTSCAPNSQGQTPPATSCYRGSGSPNFAKGISYSGIIP